MRLVVDTNRIIASLVRDSVSRNILLSDNFEFVTIGITKSEIEEHKEEFMDKAKLTEEDLIKIFSLLFSKIFVVSDMVIQTKMEEAKRIMDDIDPDDTPFIALALAIENDGIWSEDKHFKQQNKIRVWNNDDLSKLLD